MLNDSNQAPPDRRHRSLIDRGDAAALSATDGHPRMAVVDIGGGSVLNIFEVAPDAILGDRHVQGGRGAIDHFAISVDSLATLETMRDGLVDAGADIGEIQQLGDLWSLFFRDPDGMELEVCAPDDAGERPAGITRSTPRRHHTGWPPCRC